MVKDTRYSLIIMSIITGRTSLVKNSLLVKIKNRKGCVCKREKKVCKIEKGKRKRERD